MLNDILLYISPEFTSYYTGFTLILILAILGICIGFIAALFGVGGGFLLVPLMNIVLGIPIEVAAGSATCYIIGTSSTGFIKQIKQGNVEFSVFLFIALGSSVGAVLGDLLQNILIIHVSGGDSLLFERLMLIVFFVLLLIIAAIMLFTPERDINKKVFLQKIIIGPRIDLEKSNMPDISVIGLFVIGLIGGSLTGLLGVSGGVLFVPILVLAVGLIPHFATGTSLGVVLVASITAVIKKGISGPGKISLLIAFSLLIASAIGVQAGITVGQKLPSKKLKSYFGIVVIVAAIMVLYKIIAN